MKTRKPYYQLALLLLAWLTCFGAEAQEAPPQSRWTAGAEFGLPLITDCTTCDDHNTSAGVAGLNTSYRLARWLGFTFNTSFYQLESAYNQWSSEPQINNTQLKIRSRAMTLSVGPQLMLRVGQGDLSLEARYGLIINRIKTEGYDYLGGPTEAQSSLTRMGVNAVRIAYTYWPKSRFGIQLGIESSDNQFRSTFPILIDDEPIARGILSTGFTQLSLMLGTHYRF